jgi:hypothetical protein
MLDAKVNPGTLVDKMYRVVGKKICESGPFGAPNVVSENFRFHDKKDVQ